LSQRVGVGLVWVVQPDVPVLVYHVALGMPVLILAIAEYLDKLLKNGIVTSVTALSEAGGVVIVAIDAAVMFVVAVLCPKDGGTDGAGKVLDMVFPIECGYVRTAQSISACETDEIQSFEIVLFAQGVLVWAFVGDGKELGSYNLTALLETRHMCQLAKTHDDASMRKYILT
jgi:hypothetical protein